MSETKKEKIERLKASQGRLKINQSNVFNLQIQQEALKKGLLLRKPMSEDRYQKQARLRESSRIEKSFRLRRDKEERKRMRVIEKLRKEHKISNGKKLNSLFFLQGKKRRR